MRQTETTDILMMWYAAECAENRANMISLVAQVVRVLLCALCAYPIYSDMTFAIPPVVVERPSLITCSLLPYNINQHAFASAHLHNIDKILCVRDERIVPKRLRPGVCILCICTAAQLCLSSPEYYSQLHYRVHIFRPDDWEAAAGGFLSTRNWRTLGFAEDNYARRRVQALSHSVHLSARLRTNGRRRIRIGADRATETAIDLHTIPFRIIIIT